MSVLGSAPQDRLLLRIEEAADRLGIGRSLMYRLVLSGEVESIRVGRLRRIPVDSLDQAIAKLRAEQSSP